ncbi:hypothetical protein NS506_02460 [Nocardia seriolae]|uniref:Capsular polysaccharide biosynthesis protein n=1 Tax=Nocardia seriolae TaxID=37332 RepID=A0ABC8AQL5_9NOCA|nr:hypothetical protein [Nocardia seriolae]APA96524.1 hypothetical protein NS506_02460 [Nocardia seriolae]
MDLFDVARSCARRWYVILPLLILCLLYGKQTYAAAKPVYYANAVIGFAPPSFRMDQAVAGEPVRRNGLLDVGGATLLANLAALGLRQPAVIDKVVAGGGQPNYVARLFPVTTGSQQIPLVMLEETAADPQSASKTLELVTAQADPTLRTLQQHAAVPEDQMVSSFTVQPPSTPVAATPSRTRSTISVLAAGVGLSILLTVLLDVAVGRLNRKRQRPAPPIPFGSHEPVAGDVHAANSNSM